MNKKAKDKEEKENHPFKHKLKVLLTLFMCLTVILLTAIYITYLVTHKDKNKNPNTYNENSGASLIEKNMIDAFSNTKNAGKFSFSLSDSNRKTNQSLTFDFSYIKDTILSFIFYGSTIKMNYLDPITFEFIITSYF